MTISDTRFLLTTLTLHNFKSYANTVVVGPFAANFNAVVGPNGSGKSNVIDALQFVFGYRARRMRMEKIAELIHNSAQYPDIKECWVMVTFEQTNPHEIIRIKRTADHNSKSTYYINEKLSSYKQVTDLLKEKGVDLDHKRFLILQGEVESIAQMKPKAQNEHEDGLLEYLEDIIGSAQYKDKIEELDAQLDSLGDQRNEKVSRVRMIENEKEALQAERDETLEYIRLENLIVESENILYQISTSETQQAIEVSKQKLEEYTAELEKHQAITKAEAQTMKTYEDNYESARNAHTDLADKASNAKKELGKHDKEAISLNEEKKHHMKGLKKLEQSIAKESKTVTENETWVKEFEIEITKKNSELEKVNKESEAAQAELETIRESMHGKTDGFQRQIEAKQAELSPWAKKIAEKESAIAIAQSELDILRERQGENTQNSAAAMAKVQELEANIVVLEQNIKHHGKVDRAANKQLTQLKTDLSNLLNQEATLKAESSEVRQKLQDSESTAAVVQSNNNVITKLLKAQEEGRLQGIFGRLGNLGVIESQYDVAISSSCGSLDNILVDTNANGQRCVEYLRKFNLGRATFIILEKMNKPKAKSQTPESVPRLFDLVKPKEAKFAPAFYQVLKETLVAKDLDQANRIAYGPQRYRVVTLDGKIIDQSGTMTGGGTRIARGGMGSSFGGEQAISAQEAVALRKRMEEISLQVQNLQKEKPSIEQCIAELEIGIPAERLASQKAEMEVASSRSQIKSLHERLEGYRTSKRDETADLHKIKHLTKDIATYSDELKNLQTSSSGIESDIKLLQDKLMEVGGLKMRTQSAKVQMVLERLNGLTDAIASIKVKAAGAAKAAAKSRKIVTTESKELEELSSTLEEVSDKIKNNAKITERLRDEYEHFNGELEELAETAAKYKEELDEKVNAMRDVRKAEARILASVQEESTLIRELQHKLKDVQAKLARLKLNDDYSEGSANILAKYTSDELKSYEKDDMKNTISSTKEQVQGLNANVAILKQYDERQKEYEQRARELEDFTQNRDQVKLEYDTLRQQRLDEFMRGFNEISQKLKEMYQMITLGGNAELELMDSMDPFSEGIQFSVMPPKKSWKAISNLSGGEKTLSSLALVFALHHFKPTPVYVMDEIDAALDFRNVSIIANYIKDRTKDAQFIIISLRNNMFELADRLVGIYKTENCTKVKLFQSITLNPQTMAANLIASAAS